MSAEDVAFDLLVIAPAGVILWAIAVAALVAVVGHVRDALS